MTRAQRLRYQKGLERAEENIDKLELKRAKSSGKGKLVKERAKGWDDINVSGTRKIKNRNAFEDIEEDNGKEREWVSDEEMDNNDLTAPIEGEVQGEGKQIEAEVLVPESVPLPAAVAVEGEEML